MKIITPQLFRFAVVISVLTIVFRFSLSHMIENKSGYMILIIAILYFLGMFMSGFHFGKKDREYLPIYDVGFRFHFTTYFIYNGISELWFMLGLNSGYETISVVHYTAIIWGGFILMHALFYIRAKRKSIDNLDKRDLFE